jgi:hypothetical protein
MNDVERISLSDQNDTIDLNVNAANFTVANNKLSEINGGGSSDTFIINGSMLGGIFADDSQNLVLNGGAGADTLRIAGDGYDRNLFNVNTDLLKLIQSNDSDTSYIKGIDSIDLSKIAGFGGASDKITLDTIDSLINNLSDNKQNISFAINFADFNKIAANGVNIFSNANEVQQVSYTNSDGDNVTFNVTGNNLTIDGASVGYNITYEMAATTT